MHIPPAQTPGEAPPRPNPDAELDASSDTFALLFESSGLAQGVVHAGTGTFLAVNRQAVLQFGHSREAFLHMTVHDLPGPWAGRSRGEALQLLQTSGPASAWAAQHRYGDGRTAWIETRCQRARFASQACFLVSLREVSAPTSERAPTAEPPQSGAARDRALEDALCQAEKMEAIGRLAGGVAHDFNNMLSVILGIGACLVRELPADSPVRADVQEMVAAGRRASNLTQQLLAFSRKQLLLPRVLRLNDLVHETERMLRHVLPVQVAVRISLPDAPVYVEADAGQLQQCIANLVLNARDAMPQGGELTISLGLAHLDPQRDSNANGLPGGLYARLCITDTGEGMDASVAARVFEPFFTTHKAAGRGTGLGLSSVYGTVQQSGGDVLVRSAIARGTTFEVLLPAVAAPAAVEAAPLPADRAASGAPAHERVVLVVEDEPMVRELARRVLAEAHYRVIEAADGEQALALAAAFGERPIDLLLTDVIMPKLSGPELASLLAASRPALKVLYMSGYTSDSFTESAGLAINFLDKPFEPDALVARVRQILEDDVDAVKSPAPPAPLR
jgi:signal transduction histidine kinase/CheY-like chemotaxis protein